MTTFRRFGRSFTDKDPNRAEFDRDIESSIQDLQGVEIEVTTPATPDTEFAVSHKLRKIIPRAFEVLRTDKGGIVYCSRRAEWTTSCIFLKCTTASDTVLLRVR